VALFNVLDAVAGVTFNDLCVAAMRPCVKLLLPVVNNHSVESMQGYMAEAENRSLCPDNLSDSNSSLCLSTSSQSSVQQTSTPSSTTNHA